MKNALLLPAWLLTAVVLACGGGSENGDETSDPDLSAQQILERAAEESSQVESFHFELTHENGTTPLPLNLELETAEGDVMVPDELQADVEAQAVGFNVNVEVIGIGEQTWVSNPFTRNWQELGGTNIRDFADPAALVSELLPHINDPERMGETNVGGVNTYHIAGNMDSSSLASVLGVAESGRTVDVEAWVGVDDMLPRRVRISGALTEAENENVVRQLDLSRFDEPVNIEPPE